MEKAHSRINWENYPSIATPLNEANLNKMDKALDEVDNRVLGLDTAKLDKSTANTMVKDVTFDESTGIFTVTLLNGTAKTIDTKLEKVVTNFRYDNQSQKLVLTLADGSEQQVDLSSLISNYEFADGNIITFIIGSDGKVTANVKDGSITETKLQPNFLANVKTEVAKAKSYADSSYENATTSRNAVNEAKQYRDEALQFRNEALTGTPEGYADLVEQVQENTVKVDTIIAKADLGIKETASGEEIHLTDSAEGKAVEFALYGKAEQNTTTGNQLFNYDAWKTVGLNGCTAVFENNGVTLTATISDAFTLYNDVFPEDAYIQVSTGDIITLSWETDKTTTGNVYIFGNATSKYMVSVDCRNANYLTYIVPDGITFVTFRFGVHTAGKTISYKNIMINKGAEPLPYENFSGGQPSPSPQYPQPIEVSGASGSVAVKSVGKNKLNFDSLVGLTDNVVRTFEQSIKVEAKKYYPIFLYSDGTEASGTYLSVSLKDANDNTILPYINNYSNTGIDISKENASKITKVVLYSNGSSGKVFDKFYLSSVDREYQPYKETLATIPAENGLASANDARDEKVKYADGSGESIQRVGKAVFDGSDDEEWTLSTANGGNQFAITIPDNGAREFLCTHFRNSGVNNWGNVPNLTYMVHPTVFETVRFRYDACTTVDEWRANLQANPMTVYYELATPIRTPLTAEEIAEIEKLQTFYPVTNISNDFDCGMSVKYYADSKNYIDKKISELATAMVNNI